MSRNIKLILSYLGAPFKGWQKSSLGPTVESTLQEALQKLIGTCPELQAASRTDAGVHATGQTVNFLTSHTIPLTGLTKGLNAHLPPEIRVLEATEMPLTFHPTLDSIGKEYHYNITNAQLQLPFYRHTHWHYLYPIDSTILIAEAKALLGAHDFSAFTNACKNPRDSHLCTLQSIALEKGPDNSLTLSVQGNRFLYKMVRNLVGTLVYIASGRLPQGSIPSLLENKDRRAAGMTAPAHGLTLRKVFYKL